MACLSGSLSSSSYMESCGSDPDFRVFFYGSHPFAEFVGESQVLDDNDEDTEENKDKSVNDQFSEFIKARGGNDFLLNFVNFCGCGAGWMCFDCAEKVDKLFWSSYQ